MSSRIVFKKKLMVYRRRDSSVGIAAGYGLDRDSIPGRGKIFLSSTESRLALGPTQPPIQWIPGALSRGVNGRGMKPTTHLHLLPKLRMVELYLHSPIRLHGLVFN
jgi:hypothetical protein